MRWLAPVALGLLICGAGRAEAAGEPWATKPGERYLRFTSRLVFGSGGFMAAGDYVETGYNYLDTDSELYAEFGINEALTLIGGATTFGYATISDRTTAYMGPIWLAARLSLPRLDERVTGLALALEVSAGLNPGWGGQWLAAGLTVDQRIWDYTATYEHYRYGAALRAGYRFGWQGYLLLTAGVRGRNQPRQLGAILHGALRFGWETDAGVDLEAGVHGQHPTGEIIRNNLTGAHGTRTLGATITLTFWLTERFAVMAGAEGNFMGAAARPGPFIVVGLVHR